MTEPQLKIISRLVRTQEGMDFLNEILIPEASENARKILYSDRSNRDELIGEGIYMDKLIKIFIDIDKKLCQMDNKTTPKWA